MTDLIRTSRQSVVAIAFGMAGAMGWVIPVHAQFAGVDPQASAVLKKSTDYLAGLKQFGGDVHAILEVVLQSGQRLQFDTAVTFTVQRPNKLVARRKGDLVNQTFYYDGKTLTLYNADRNVYATLPAPATLDGMIDLAADSLDIIAPGGDLLYSNAYDVLMQDVTSGFVVGQAVVAGVRCAHLAFRKPEVDWQIWIEEGAKPLPRRLVITSTQVSGAPQMTMTMTHWDTAPKVAEGAFTFAPPKGARQIEFLKQPAAGTK